MSTVLGLSHLIFTAASESLPPEDLLSPMYGPPEDFSDNYLHAKKAIVRDPSKARREFRLYHATGGNLPSIEILCGGAAVCRPSPAYGILLPPGTCTPDSAALKHPAMEWINAALDIRPVQFIDSLPLAVAECDLLDLHRCTMGCWMTSPDLDVTGNYFQKLLGMKPLRRTECTAIFETRVFNRTFSRFLVVLIHNDQSLPAGGYLTDDAGLATLGWIARAIPALEPELKQQGFHMGSEFRIQINQNQFDAVFVYNQDGEFTSNELLVLSKNKLNG